MISNKLAFLTTSIFVFSLGITSISLAADSSIDSQIENKNLLLAQAHQHSSEKEGSHDKHGKHKKWDEHEKEHDYAHVIISCTDALKLSDEQLGKIVRLHLKYKQEHKNIKDKLMGSVKTFRKESMNPNTSDDQLRKFAKDLTENSKAMIEHRINERSSIHTILSEDQKKQLFSMKMDHDYNEHSHH